MKTTIYSISKTKPNSPEALLEREYIKRSKWDISIKEFYTKTINKDIETQKLQESELVANKIHHSYLITLDSTGTMLSSEEFAKFLGDLQSKTSHISFCIGGAFGHHQSLLNKSNKVISLGKMTLPHKLARLILVEQIYRAETILNNHPYHK